MKLTAEQVRQYLNMGFKLTKKIISNQRYAYLYNPKNPRESIYLGRYDQVSRELEEAGITLLSP